MFDGGKDEDETDKSVIEARAALKNKFKRSHTDKKSQIQEPKSTQPTEGKELRNWVSINDKVSKKDMEKIDQSLHCCHCFLRLLLALLPPLTH